MSNDTDETDKKRIKIGMLGDSTVGKTSIVHTFMNIKFTGDNLATIGKDIIETKIKIKNEEEIILTIFDTAGQERFHSYALRAIRSVKGVVIVFDLTNEESFKNVNIWLNDIKENFKEIGIVLFGNKCDLDKNKWKVTEEQVKKFVEENNLIYFQTSAKTRENIDKGFEEIANQAYDLYDGKTNGITLKKGKKNFFKNICCIGGKKKVEKQNE